MPRKFAHPSPRRGPKQTRAGFTIVECVVALALIMILAVIITQAMVWSLQERARAAAHHAAIEVAANALEAARAQPFDKLDQAWGDAQQAPSDMDAVLPDASLKMTVAPEPNMTGCKRVTVEVRWQFVPQPAKSVQLTTLRAGRSAKKAEETP